MNIASQYAARGLALVAIPFGSKGPAAKGWNRPESAITDPASAATLRGNFGIAHAFCTPSPTMALDIDDIELATAWMANHGIDVASLLTAGDAVQILSGRPGRAKLLYRLPTGNPPLQSIAIKQGTPARTALELRCATSDGLTVQDVLPPSVHPVTGKPYQWAGRGDWHAIPAVPDALLAVWRGELASRNAPTRLAGRLSLFKGVDDTPRQRARVAEMLRHISADCDYQRYRDITWAILSLGWHDVQDIAERWCQTAPHRFDEANFWNIVNSYDASRTPTIGTIHHHAQAGGWNG